MKKSKIIALLMATACISTAFVGCGDEDKACNHVDADKNGKCDVCKTAVITITESLPAEKEEEVAMVVNPLPTGAKASDYIGPKAEDLEKEVPASVGLTKTTKLDDMTISQSKGDLYELTKTVTVEGTGQKKNVSKLYNAKTDTLFCDFESDGYITGSSPKKSRMIAFVGNGNNLDTIANGFYMVKRERGSAQTIYTISVYTTAGEEFFADEVTLQEYEDGLVGYSVKAEVKGDYEYVTVKTPEINKVYVIDVETGALVDIEGVDKKGNDVSTFIQRPEFKAVKNNIGYVIEGSTVWAYDLTKWVSCIYYNVMPSAWANAEAMVLDNGNLFVQYWKELPAEAVNYDVLESEVKYDIVQVIVNPTTAEVKTVEFGYIFAEAGKAADKYNDNAKNVVILTPIVDKAENSAATFEAVIDNDLNILYAHKATLVGQDISQFTYEAEGVYQTTVAYSSTVSVNVLVDGEGKEICKLPKNVGDELLLGLPTVEGKVYSADMKTELFKIADYGEVDRRMTGEWVIFKKVTPAEGDGQDTTEFFFFNATMTAPVKVAWTAFKGFSVGASFIVEVKTAEATKYEIYNANNEKVGSTYDAQPTVEFVDAGNLVKISGTIGEETVVEYFRK